MDEFKMELIWHNCKTCQPKEKFNYSLSVTDGIKIHKMMWDSGFGGFLKIGLEIRGDELEKYWWTDFSRTVRESKEFEVINNDVYRKALGNN